MSGKDKPNPALSYPLGITLRAPQENSVLSPFNKNDRLIASFQAMKSSYSITIVAE